MALGTRQPKQTELFVPADQIRKGSGHPLYNQLNQVLEEGGFDPFLEELCAPHYKRGGSPGIPPGVCFDMTFIRQRLPQNVLDEVFTFVLRRLRKEGKRKKFEPDIFLPIDLRSNGCPKTSEGDPQTSDRRRG